MFFNGQEMPFVPYRERIKSYFQRWPGAMNPIEACYGCHMLLPYFPTYF